MFHNTKIAFASKTSTQLKKAHFLFQTMRFNFIVKFGTNLLKIALKLNFPIQGIIKKTIFEQFCGGESIEDSEQSINVLAKYNVGAILDYSVEGAAGEDTFDTTKNEILKTIAKCKEDKNIPFCVFKPTGVGRFEIYEKVQNKEKLSKKEEFEYEKIKNRINEICKAAFKSDISILIDAEETWIQTAIDEIVLGMMLKYNLEKTIVYNTIQFYRKDGLELLKNQHQQSKNGNFYYGVKMVRGAYMEKERLRSKEKGYADRLHTTKEETDICYDDGIKYCIENMENISLVAGTHNEKSTLLLTQLLSKHKIENTNQNFYFAQLFGMSDHISFNLSEKNYNVVKYVPYGPIKEVIPYLIRRAKENTSVAGQMGRELTLIKEELKRRKKAAV